jgi:hypothetical protein
MPSECLSIVTRAVPVLLLEWHVKAIGMFRSEIKEIVEMKVDFDDDSC